MTSSPPFPVCAASQPSRVDLALVIPTYNERANIPELIGRVEAALEGLCWELLFVDDDSPDDTAEVIAQYARRDSRIRLLHRIGRRGLSTACIEGILATTANYVAIMDADMQHDETILPRMLQTLSQNSLDLVIGTRNAEGGSMGKFSSHRVLLSRLGTGVSHAICKCRLSDPMSGFFLFNRSFFAEIAHKLNGGGFKILVDMLSCAQRPVRFAEVGYTFQQRRHGQSKLEINTAIEYLILVIDKLTRGVMPVRFTAFALVGAVGLTTHLACLTLLMHVFHWSFVPAQWVATFVAMTENFFLNNLITWRDRALHNIQLITGLAGFWLACSFGAWANVLFSRTLLQSGTHWALAGIAGMILSCVWNYSVSNLLIWQTPRYVANNLEPVLKPSTSSSDS